MSSEKETTAFKPPPPLPFHMKLAVGGAAGIFGTSIIYPIDVVKTRLQSGGANNSSLGGSSPTIKSTIQSVRRKDGFRGFYRGLSANLSGILFEKGIKLALNDYAREFFIARNNGGPILLHQEILSGATAGVGQIVATNPVEVVKINLQLQSDLPDHLRKSPIGVIRDLGLRGLFKGSMSTLVRDVPFSVIFFPLVSNLRVLFGVRPDKPSVMGNFMAGIVAGAFAAGLVTPADVVKTRIQEPQSKVAGQSFLRIMRLIIKEEGFATLYRGWLPRVGVIAPLFAIVTLAFELQKMFINKI